MKRLPKEDQLKVLAVADDILDRDGWITGQVHAVPRDCGNPYCPFVAAFRYITEEEHRNAHMTSVTDASVENQKHCMIGGLEAALVQLGYLDGYTDDPYDTVGKFLGLTEKQTDNVYVKNDSHERLGRGRAYRYVTQIIERRKK